MSIRDAINRLVGNKPPLAGIDIGHSTIKCVEIEKTSQGFRLKHADVEPIEPGEDNRVSDEAVSRAIERLVNRNGLRGSRVVTAVSGEAVIVRPIPVPVVSEKEDISLVVQSEARDFIPFNAGDVIMDFQRLGLLEGERGKTQEVLVVAAQREMVGRHLDLLTPSGVESVIVDAGSIALMNAMIAGSSLGEDKTVALVSIGSEITNIAIVRKNTARFARDLSVAGRNITKSVMSDLGVSFEEAENLKRQWGLRALFAKPAETETTTAKSERPTSIVDEVYAAIDSLDPEAHREDVPMREEDRGGAVAALAEHVLSDILNEVKRSLLFYENQMDGEAVDLVLLSGGTALLPGVTRYFEQNLEVPTRILEPLEQIDNDYTDEERAAMGPLLAMGIGLALRCAA